MLSGIIGESFLEDRTVERREGLPGKRHSEQRDRHGTKHQGDRTFLLLISDKLTSEQINNPATWQQGLILLSYNFQESTLINSPRKKFLHS